MNTEQTQRHAPKGPIKARPQATEDQIRDPTRCRARTKCKGGQCPNYPMRGGYVCRMHGGGAPQVRAKAAERLEALYPRAITVVGELLEEREFPTVRLGAAKLTIEQQDGRPREQVDMRVSGELALTTRVAAARRRLREAESPAEG